jgi:putative transposase
MIARHVKLKMNKKLKKQLGSTLWNLTGVYNWTIKTIDLRKNLGLSYSEFDILNLLSNHSKKCGVSSRALAGTVNDAFGAWQKCWSKQNGKPRLKGARNPLNSIQFRGDCKLYPETNQIKLPNFGKVRFHELTGGFPEGKTASTVRLIQKASGWYAVLLFETKHEQIVLASNTKIGIDTGFKNLIATSDGQKFNHPRELEKSLAKLGKVQRGRSKKRAARLHEKIANQRKDRNHKISHGLVRDHAEIYVTSDNLKGQAKIFGKQIASSGIGQLRQFILYKGSSCGRVVELVDSKYSTMRCSACQSLTGPTGLNNLNIRNWECEACGAEHDRDVNAAINTLNAGARYALDKALEVSQETVKQLKKFGLSPQNCPGRAVS